MFISYIHERERTIQDSVGQEGLVMSTTIKVRKMAYSYSHELATLQRNMIIYTCF